MRQLAVLALLPLALAAFAQDEAGVERAKAKFQELHKERKFPGGTVAIVWADGKSATFSAGEFSPGKELKSTDRMLAGSIGKTFVAAAFLQVAKRRGSAWMTR